MVDDYGCFNYNKFQDKYSKQLPIKKQYLMITFYEHVCSLVCTANFVSSCTVHLGDPELTVGIKYLTSMDQHLTHGTANQVDPNHPPAWVTNKRFAENGSRVNWIKHRVRWDNLSLGKVECYWDYNITKRICQKKYRV